MPRQVGWYLQERGEIGAVCTDFNVKRVHPFQSKKSSLWATPCCLFLTAGVLCPVQSWCMHNRNSAVYAVHEQFGWREKIVQLLCCNWSYVNHAVLRLLFRVRKIKKKKNVLPALLTASLLHRLLRFLMRCLIAFLMLINFVFEPLHRQ